MKVLWVAGPTEIETDVEDDCRLAGIDCTVVDMYQNRVEDLPTIIRQERADLTVLRHPFYLAQETHAGIRAEIQSIDLPILAWSSEQGPTKNDGECLLGKFRNRAVNNQHDAALGSYRYMPFGCTDRAVERVPIIDYVVDSNKPHYACNCAGRIKAESVDIMVAPLFGDPGLSIYGTCGGPCGWGAVQEARENWQGTFHPAALAYLLAQYRVYVGISWNWQSAGYGCKLARAMATGIPVVWHRTPHMALDGLEEGRNILCSSSPEETKERVREALAKPEIGVAGRRFALDNWRWSKLLTEMANVLR